MFSHRVVPIRLQSSSPYWPVLHRNDSLVIHFRRPVESAMNLQEGDCFFDVPLVLDECGGSLSFNYVKGQEVIHKAIPSDELQVAFTEEYLDKLLSENGSTVSSHNLIVMTAQGQIKRLPLVEFALRHVERVNEVRQEGTDRRNVSKYALSSLFI